jgi:hypothetical protein
VIYQADAALHASDNGDGSLGKTTNVAEYFAHGQNLYLTVRFLLPEGDARRSKLITFEVSA